MADPALVKKYLSSIEDDRKAGRATIAPSRLHPGNILGGETDAFIEAVKQQGKQSSPADASSPWSAAEDEEKRVNALKGIRKN